MEPQNCDFFRCSSEEVARYSCQTCSRSSWYCELHQSQGCKFCAKESHDLVLENPEEGTANQEDYEWLTYETVYNQHIFRKTNQLCQMGLYLMPLNNVRILLQRKIDPNILIILTEAFFPDLKPHEVEKKARGDCPWQPQLLCEFPSSPTMSNACRETNILHIPPRAVMPYNFIDNYYQSSSIGSDWVSPIGKVELVRLKHTWKMWKTASRSCVVEIGKVELEGKENKNDKPFWDCQQPLDEKVILENVNGVMRFHLKSLNPHCFSIKTGIKWVGKTDMGGMKENVGKDVFYGCLQSDMIKLFDEKKGHSNKADACMVILPEIMGVMEDSPFFPKANSNNKKGDGFLVRDLSSLKPNRIYLPAISIPFLDTDLKELKQRFECFPSCEWQDFWKVNYAELLGWAKALLLIRYGLQLETPNGQNFLLEFDPRGKTPQPTGRIFIRDIGDALPMLDIFFCLHSKYNADKANITEKTFNDERLFPIYQCLGPHSANLISLGWHEYSAFSKGKTVAGESGIGFDPDARKNWRFVLRIMAEWGLAHAKSYVRCIQECLQMAGFEGNILYRETLFVEYPSPEKFTDCKHEDFQSALIIFNEYVEWEKWLCKEIQAYLMENWTIFDALKTTSWDQKFIPESNNDYVKYFVDRTTSKQSSNWKNTDNDQGFERDEEEWS